MNSRHPAATSLAGPGWGVIFVLVCGAILLAPGEKAMSGAMVPAIPDGSSYAAAQESRQRNVTGQVVDPQGRGVAQAVVHLKNKRTLEIKTRISDEEGGFYFRGLNSNVDYEVHAEYQGQSSAARTVSLFDDRPEIYVVLEIASSE